MDIELCIQPLRVLEFLHLSFPIFLFSRRVWSQIYWFPIWTVPIVLVGTWTIEYLTTICASQKSATMAPWKRKNIAMLELNANLDQPPTSNMVKNHSWYEKIKNQKYCASINNQLLILVSSQKKTNKLKIKICMTKNSVYSSSHVSLPFWCFKFQLNFQILFNLYPNKPKL